jgi:hypothetical protein
MRNDGTFPFGEPDASEARFGVYPRGMSGKPSEPACAGRPEAVGGSLAPEPPDEQAPRHGSSPLSEPERNGERSGPVAIARHVKSDGRALILYTREPTGVIRARKPRPPA